MIILEVHCNRQHTQEAGAVEWGDLHLTQGSQAFVHLCPSPISTMQAGWALLGEAHIWGTAGPSPGLTEAWVKQVHMPVRNLLLLMTILDVFQAMKVISPQKPLFIKC